MTTPGCKTRSTPDASPRSRRGAIPTRAVLTQGVGLEQPPEPEVSVTEAREEDIFLVCSDGLTSMVTDEGISQLLSETLGEGLEATAEALVEAANQEGGFDNVSVALLRVDQGAEP